MTIESAFKSFLEAIHPLTEEEWGAVAGSLRRSRLPVDGHALRAGEVENDVRFLGRGILRQYYVKEGREYNKEIYLAPSIVSSYTSFLTREPSTYAIQALEESELLSIHRGVILDLYSDYHAWERLGRMVVEGKYVLKERREAMLLLDTAEERYARLKETNGDLLQKVNLYSIASYLGITPETLSRIRGRPTA